MTDKPEWFRGAVDLHTHSHPSIFPRRFDDRELCRHAAEAGMAAVVLKAHEGSTVERAFLAETAVSGFRVRGGIVLNHFVGGLNPHAVEMAIALGATLVWMPTLHAANHLRFYDEPAFREQPSARQLRRPAPLTVLDERGRLTDAAQEVLDMVSAYPEVILSNGHLDALETVTLFREASRKGIERLVVAHPGLPLTNFGVDVQLELAAIGATLEHSYLPHLAGWGGLRIEVTAEHIRRVGVDRCVLSSDLGQVSSPPPAEGLEAFGRELLGQGFMEQEVRRMLVENPAALLSL